MQELMLFVTVVCNHIGSWEFYALSQLYTTADHGVKLFIAAVRARCLFLIFL